jgi:hypothetical protein
VIATVCPEAKQDPRGFRQACERAMARLDKTEKG